MKHKLKMPSAGNAIGFAALVLAITGVAYAGSKVGPNQIKPGAVRTKALADASVTAPKLANGSVITPKFGPEAVAPQAVEAGYADMPNYHAQVSATGVVNGTRSRNITSTDVSKGGTGVYCFSGLPFTPSGGQATADANSAGTPALPQFGLAAEGSSGCPSGTQAVVRTRSLDTGSLIDAGFFVTIY
jgi:hypothetical protein